MCTVSLEVVILSDNGTEFKKLQMNEEWSTKYTHHPTGLSVTVR